jgi:hypothetical protein
MCKPVGGEGSSDNPEAWARPGDLPVRKRRLVTILTDPRMITVEVVSVEEDGGAVQLRQYLDKQRKS